MNGADEVIVKVHEIGIADIIGDDGDFFVRDAQGNMVWNTNTSDKRHDEHYAELSVHFGSYLLPGQYIHDYYYERYMVYHPNGDLVFLNIDSDKEEVLWTSETAGKKAGSVFVARGLLVINDCNDDVVFESNTSNATSLIIEPRERIAVLCNSTYDKAKKEETILQRLCDTKGAVRHRLRNRLK